jgi:hypothetical protein
MPPNTALLPTRPNAGAVRFTVGAWSRVETPETSGPISSLARRYPEVIHDRLHDGGHRWVQKDMAHVRQEEGLRGRNELRQPPTMLEPCRCRWS